jgi:hypothetical protein
VLTNISGSHIININLEWITKETGLTTSTQEEVAEAIIEETTMVTNLVAVVVTQAEEVVAAMVVEEVATVGVAITGRRETGKKEEVVVEADMEVATVVVMVEVETDTAEIVGEITVVDLLKATMEGTQIQVELEILEALLIRRDLKEQRLIKGKVTMRVMDQQRISA